MVCMSSVPRPRYLSPSPQWRCGGQPAVQYDWFMDLRRDTPREASNGSPEAQPTCSATSACFARELGGRGRPAPARDIRPRRPDRLARSPGRCFHLVSLRLTTCAPQVLARLLSRCGFFRDQRSRRPHRVGRREDALLKLCAPSSATTQLPHDGRLALTSLCCQRRDCTGPRALLRGESSRTTTIVAGRRRHEAKPGRTTATAALCVRRDGRTRTRALRKKSPNLSNSTNGSGQEGHITRVLRARRDREAARGVEPTTARRSPKLARAAAGPTPTATSRTLLPVPRRSGRRDDNPPLNQDAMIQRAIARSAAWQPNGTRGLVVVALSGSSCSA